MGTSPKQIIYLFVFIIFIILIRTAWVADDAFLTMRTVDNFVNGYGLRWNVLERVQIYTHPMWMFLLSGVYYFIRDPFPVFYGLTILLSIIAIYIFGVKFTTSPAKAVVGFSVLIFSKAFIDYSTSWLEIPLTHLLIVVFLAVLRRPFSQYCLCKAWRRNQQYLVDATRTAVCSRFHPKGSCYAFRDCAGCIVGS